MSDVSSFPPAQIRCLLVDDDPGIRELLTGFLQPFHMRLDAVADGISMRQRLPSAEVDVLLLDVMLPGENGLDLCQWVKRVQPGLPVIMLTAQGDTLSRVLGLELGADDYLPKPFEPRELAARLATILRRVRAPAPAGTSLRFDGLAIDTVRRAVQRDGQAVDLTSTEYELLLLLAREPGRVWTRDEILNRLRGQDALDLHTRAVDILVSRLRRKLEPLDCIKTLRNAGYTFAGARV